MHAHAILIARRSVACDLCRRSRDRNNRCHAENSLFSHRHLRHHESYMTTGIALTRPARARIKVRSRRTRGIYHRPREAGALSKNLLARVKQTRGTLESRINRENVRVSIESRDRDNIYRAATVLVDVKNVKRLLERRNFRRENSKLNREAIESLIERRLENPGSLSRKDANGFLPFYQAFDRITPADEIFEETSACFVRSTLINRGPKKSDSLSRRAQRRLCQFPSRQDFLISRAFKCEGKICQRCRARGAPCYDKLLIQF